MNNNRILENAERNKAAVAQLHSLPQYGHLSNGMKLCARSSNSLVLRE